MARAAAETGEATSTSAAVATQHNQVRTLFKKKSRSKAAVKRARRAVNFSRKVDKVINKVVYGPRVYTYISLGQVSSAAGGQQLYSVSLNGMNGFTALTPLNQHDDVSELFTVEGLVTDSDQLYLKSSRLDVTLSCPNTTETAIIDAYEFMFKHSLPDSYNATGVTPETILTSIIADATAQTAAGSTIVTTDVGWTPMTVGLVGKYATVTNHTRFILNSGNHNTYTIKDKINRRISKIDANSGSFKPKLSKMVIFIVSGRSDAAPAGDTLVLHYPAVSLNFQAYKTYWYNRIASNLAKAGEAPP